jgi:hypothetical protein
MQHVKNMSSQKLWDPEILCGWSLSNCNKHYIMKRLYLIALTFAAPLAVMAQTTILTDNFTTDSSLGAEWFNMSNTVNAAVALNPTTGQGLALTVSSGTGKVNEEFAQFSASPITLTAVGDYITLIVNFNSPNVTGNTGGLLAGLYYTQGTVATGNLLGTGTGGATADDQGYFGIMGFNTSAGTSTKFYTRQGGVSDANELGYYSSMTAGSYAQLSTFAASGNGNIANGLAYTLTYTVTKGASSDTITAVITQGASPVDSWTTTDASGLYNSFDELDFGGYGKAGFPSINITGIEVIVPEPSTITLGGLCMLGLLFVRRMRR